MTYPPPPPDRMHLQHQPSPMPPQQPQQMGPGGAYGPMQQSPGQPIPGQLPPAGLSMTKPGTVTGIQVILWIFTAIGAVGNLFSIIGMVEYFDPIQLLFLAYAVYTTIQSIVSPIQIARGKRWAWVWSIVSSILGLALALTGFIIGAALLDSGGDMMLAIAAALVALYGTLLGLLCSKSARQWILMHRMQRGQAQLPGGMGGFGPGAQGPMAQGGMAMGGTQAPERPATRPVSATVAAVAALLFAAVGAWGVYSVLHSIQVELDFLANSPWEERTFMDILMRGQFLEVLAIHVGIYAFLLIAGVITAPLILKGKVGGRVFGLIWSIVALLASAYLIWSLIDAYTVWDEYYRFPNEPNPLVGRIVRDVSVTVLSLAFFILMLTPGVRAWTPGSGGGALIVMVPMGQQPQQQQQQAGPYGPPQHGPQQPGPYGPPQQAPHQQYPPQR